MHENEREILNTLIQLTENEIKLNTSIQNNLKKILEEGKKLYDKEWVTKMQDSVNDFETKRLFIQLCFEYLEKKLLDIDPTLRKLNDED